MAGNPQVGIDIVAKATGFQAEFQKISAQAQAAADKVSGAFGTMRNAATALGVGLSVAGFTAFVKGAIDAADKLNDLSKVTGVGATTLGGIGFAAQQAGTDLEGVAKAFGKMQLLIADAQAGNEKAAGTFAKLGISIGDLRTLKPDQIFAKIADAFSTYEDDANKAAGANLIFGKTWSSVVPLLDEGGDSLRKNISYFERYSGVTTDLVQASDQFNDSMTKLRLLQGAFANQLAAELLPGLQKLVEYLVQAKEKGDGFKSAAADIADGLKVVAKFAIASASAVKDFGNFLGSLGAQASAYLQGDYARVVAIGNDFDEQMARRKQQLGDLGKIVSDATRAGAVDANGFHRSGINALAIAKKRPTPSFGDAGGGAAKSEVDAFAKALDRVSKMAAEAQLELQGMFSTQEITSAQKALAQLVASDEWKKFSGPQQSELTARFQAIEAVQRETLEWKKKNEEQAKTIKLYEQEQEALAKAKQAFTETLGNYADENDYLSRSIALVGEDDAARQKLAATIEYESLRKKALLADDEAGLAILDEQYQKRIALIQQLSDATKKFGEVQRYNAIFADAFAESLTSIVDGTKSLKDAFKDMEKSIVSSISRIAAQKLTDALFGVGPGQSGGIGNILFNLFNSGSSGFDWSKLFGGFNFGSLFGGGGASAIGNMGADFLIPGFASGGNPDVNRVSLVGEKGPELIFPRSPVTVQPIKPGKGGVGYGRERAYNISISQTFNGNGSSASVRQVRAAARDGVMAAVRDR